MKLFNFLALSLIISSAIVILGEPEARKADYPIEKLFLERQSKYALHRTLTAPEMKQKLMSLFEAARWGASSFNNQPWRYIYGIHATPSWTKLFNVVNSRNQRWAEHAGVLILVVSQTKSDHNDKPLPTHSFDAGLASAHILLQATALGLVAHPICGFDAEKARKDFKIPASYHIEAMIVVGEPASKEHAQKELAARDEKSSGRKKVSQIAGDGALPA